MTVILGNLLGDPWYAQVLRHNRQINVPGKVSTLGIIQPTHIGRSRLRDPPPDSSINGKYYLYPDGLVSLLKRVGHPVLVTQDESDNEAQLAKLHVPSYRSIKPDSNEQAILDAYATVALHIGQAYALAGNKGEALVWYRKALAIDPTLTAAARSIRNIGGTTD